MDRIYTSETEARDGTRIPVFRSGRTMESKYSPRKSAEQQLSAVPEHGCGAILITGLGGGEFALAAAKRFPDKLILAAENSPEDIEFLGRFPAAARFIGMPNTAVFSVADTESALMSEYVPAVHGNLHTIEQKPWIHEAGAAAEALAEGIRAATEKIGADFSAQSHFGKIWQRNIIQNLRNISEGTVRASVPAIPAEGKTAAVFAAGPGAERQIPLLRNDRNRFFVIAADTAAGILLGNGITPDAVVSIDGQNVSCGHFLGRTGKLKNTTFVFDLCAEPSAAESVASAGSGIFFTTSGHPLAELAGRISGGTFPRLATGSGTVTIAALDFARQAGFRNVTLYGADFAYPGGKPYSRGTYLDARFESSGDRLLGLEKQFCALMFRTELMQNAEGIPSTPVLESYRKTAENFITGMGGSFLRKDGIYTIEFPGGGEVLRPRIQEFRMENIYGLFSRGLPEFAPKPPFPPEISALLPFLAYLRSKPEYRTWESRKLLKLAHDALVRYTRKI